MLIKLNRSLVVYLLCAALTFSMGMAAHTTKLNGIDPVPVAASAAEREPVRPLPVSGSGYAAKPTAVHSSVAGAAKIPAASAVSKRLQREQAAMRAPAATVQTAEAMRAPAATVQTAEAMPATAAAVRTAEEAAPAPAATVRTAAPTPRHAMYEISAYYLNVRAEPDKSSAIVAVLEKGMQVYVAEWTDNGWLGLRDGGYIHGSYAERLASTASADAEPKRKQEVSVLSASPPAALPAVLKPQKPGSKVEAASGLTKEAIAKLLEGTALENHGLEEAILEVEAEYGINAYFTIAVMKLESGNGKSRLARDKNNLFGLNATGGSNSKAYSFETKGDSVHKFGSLIAKSYIGKGYTTIEKIAKKYCPPNPKWPSLVKNIMNRDHKKLTKAKLV